MDISSLLLGVGVGILGAFGTGFLKKAGEDSYAWIKRKLNPKSVEHHSPQLVIQLGHEGTNQPADTSLPIRLEPATIELVSSFTFQDIADTIAAAPPMQRDQVAEKYKGLRVDWDTYFKGGTQSGDDIISLRLGTEPRASLNTVKCEVLAKDYRELGILPAGAKIRVSGEIESASQFDIELSDVRLHIQYERQ